QELLGVVAVVGIQCFLDAHRQEILTPFLARDAWDEIGQRLGLGVRRLSYVPWHDHDKFVPAHVSHIVVLPAMFLEAQGHLPQQLVAFQMPEPVLHLLEAVKSHRCRLASRTACPTSYASLPNFATSDRVRFWEWCVAVSMAEISIARRPCFSSSWMAEMVTPPGVIP